MPTKSSGAKSPKTSKKETKRATDKSKVMKAAKSASVSKKKQS